MSKKDMKLDPSVIFARNVDWNLFKVFYEIGKRGGIGAAARSLNKTQPSISIALKRLEEHIGAPLCSRTRRGIDLTVEGRQVLEACHSVLGTIQSLPRAASAARNDITGSVSMRVISNLYLVPELSAIFEEFHQLYPRIDVRLDVSPWREVLHSIKDGEVELAIGFDDGIDERLRYVTVSDQQQQIYCGPHHPLYGKEQVSPEQLRSDPFVVTPDEPTRYVKFRTHQGLGRTIGGVADNLQERMWLIQMGLGIGILPVPVVNASRFESTLWPLLVDANDLICRIHLIANAEAVRSAPAQLLLNTALTHLRAESDPDPHGLRTTRPTASPASTMRCASATA